MLIKFGIVCLINPYNDNIETFFSLRIDIILRNMSKHYLRFTSQN